eukprot:TRINITY_DN18372_c0_g1_i1.p1 TRINITY_DN18372_c0_g1~~TRINITY_DN18372_c0_g1_i1.p1  ORF type:complete len:939 (-),score=139.61 TRINITY_DN18372_c0_g1_i1:49-2865(-)
MVHAATSRCALQPVGDDATMVEDDPCNQPENLDARSGGTRRDEVLGFCKPPDNLEAQSGGTKRNEVLGLCLSLNSVDLGWLCSELVRQRTDCYGEAYLNFSNLELLDGDFGFGRQKLAISTPEATVLRRRLSSDRGENLEAFKAAEVIAERIRARDIQLQNAPPADLKPVVQFEASMYYADESKKIVEFGVMRLGDTTGVSSVAFTTRDISAKAGIKYIATQGTVHFDIGDRLKTFTVETIDDSNWDATLEFCVELIEDSLVNCVLGKYLWCARVKVMDDDYFPNNRFAKTLVHIEGRREEFDNLNLALLMWDYFMTNLRNKTVRTGLLKSVLADQFGNLNFILGLFLQLMLIDRILCAACIERNEGLWGMDTETSLFIVVIFKVALFPIMHWLSYREAFWKVGGATRMTLQSNLLRKYLSYDIHSLQNCSESRLVLAITRDSRDLAADAFCQIPALIAALTRLAMITVYQLATPAILGVPFPKYEYILVRLAPSFLFPIAMFTFMRIRNQKTETYLEVANASQNDMIQVVSSITEKSDLFRDYRKRGFIIDVFQTKIAHFNKCFAESTSIQKNNEMFAVWCIVLVSAAWMWIGGNDVARPGGDLLLGDFLNTLGILNAQGEMWGQVYNVLLKMQRSFDALETITELMNMPTELKHQAACFENNLVHCRRAKEAAVTLDKGITTVDPNDRLCIELRHLSFTYRSQGLATNQLRASSVSLPQGGLYLLAGGPSEGKGTILKLLGEVLLPRLPGHTRTSDAGSGDLIVPSHLRSLHVSSEPMFIEGTLMDNLLLGVAAGKETQDGSKERVLNLCSKLGLSRSVLDCIEQNSLTVPWRQVLSHTEAALLHMARAFVANPELLCVHKPTLYFGEDISNRVHEMQKQFVVNRGLDQPSDKFWHRRPRTCIFTASVSQSLADLCDGLFIISNGGITAHVAKRRS